MNDDPKGAFPDGEEFRAKGLCGVEHFKDNVCGYAGAETWCDRSRVRCAALNNLDRFDGVLPAIKEPWELPKWEILGGSGMLATLLLELPWHFAALFYALSALMIVPAIRQMVYWRCLHRSSEQDQDTSP